MRLDFTFALTLALIAALSGCSNSDSSSGGSDAGYNPKIDPANFVSAIDNQFSPWKPGMKLTYLENGTDTIVVTVMPDTKVIMGVTCVVVHDQLTDETGAVAEDTLDWYAQDKAGNVWYFGEATTEYTDAGPSTEGSWEGGKDGALPGIIMQADPKVGEPYRQEYYPNHAEDMGQVIDVNQAVTVTAGSYTGCIVTKDWSALTPAIVENKWFCPGVGEAKAATVQGGSDSEELTAAVLP
jgi:hypothetical protein